MPTDGFDHLGREARLAKGGGKGLALGYFSGDDSDLFRGLEGRWRRFRICDSLRFFRGGGGKKPPSACGQSSRQEEQQRKNNFFPPPERLLKKIRGKDRIQPSILGFRFWLPRQIRDGNPKTENYYRVGPQQKNFAPGANRGVTGIFSKL
jgi:hypothetical protein